MPGDPDAALRELREKVVRSITEVSEGKYAAAIRSSILDRLQGNADAYTWAPYQLIYDSPDKSQPGEAATAASITESLRKTVIDARKELLVITAYFVLRDEEIDGFREYRERGIDVFVLTNSLASNNHTISHSAMHRLENRYLRPASGYLSSGQTRASPVINVSGSKMPNRRCMPRHSLWTENAFLSARSTGTSVQKTLIQKWA